VLCFSRVVQDSAAYLQTTRDHCYVCWTALHLTALDISIRTFNTVYDCPCWSTQVSALPCGRLNSDVVAEWCAKRKTLECRKKREWQKMRNREGHPQCFTSAWGRTWEGFRLMKGNQASVLLSRLLRMFWKMKNKFMAVGRIVSRGGASGGSFQGGTSGEISFYPLEGNWDDFFCQNFNRKLSNF